MRGFCGGAGEGWGGFAGDDSSAGRAGHNQLRGGSGGEGPDGGGGKAGGINEFDVVYPKGGGAGSGCIPPFKTAEQCGSCNTACADPTPVCTAIGNNQYECQVKCEDPYVNCFNRCVELNSDSDHCGACGAACPSAICNGGKCVGAQAGHIVAICMNYREASQGSQATTLLGNAVFLPMPNPIKILAYSEFAESNVQRRVDTAIGWAGAARGRSYQITTITNPDELSTKLKKTDYDVFLIYDQQLAPDGVLGNYGVQWIQTLESFSFVGGVIVVLDGSTGARQMGEFMTNAAILPVTGETAFNREQAYNRDPADILGANVVSPFLAPRDSCVFSTSATNDATTSLVVTDNPSNVADRRPLAVHRIAIPTID
jgi:hypothetical protein